MSNQDDLFFQVPKTRCTTSEGEAEVPILYFAASSFLAFFLVEREAADAKLQGTGLRPAVAVGNRVLLGIDFFEYRRTSIGAYNEVGIAIPVVPVNAPPVRNLVRALYGPVDERRVGLYVLDLPVTTAIACAGGKELWGFPKFLTEISFDLSRTRFEASVLDPEAEGEICSLSGHLLPGIPTPPMSLVTYSHLNDVLLRTTVNVRGRMTLRAGATLRLTVSESKHRMAQNLRDLSLDGARPILSLDTHDFQSRLNAGVPVGETVAPRLDLRRHTAPATVE